MLVYQRVFVIVPTVIIDGFHHLNDCSFKCYLFAVCQCEPSLASHVPDGFPRYNLRAFKLGMIGVKSIIPILHSVPWSSSEPFYIYMHIEYTHRNMQILSTIIFGEDGSLSLGISQCA